jgi:methionyl-tRNA formyltransferase
MKSGLDFRFARVPSQTGDLNEEDISKPSVELIGEGVLSVLMLEELSKRGVNVTHYVFKDIPKTQIDRRIKAQEFSDKESWIELIGKVSYPLVFNLGLKIPDKILKRTRVLGLHPSYLPDEYIGEKDPVKAMVEQGREYGAVTLFQLDPAWDTGPVYGHIRFKFRPDPKRNRDEDIISKIYTTSVVPAAAKLFAEYMKNPIKYMAISQRMLLDNPDMNKRF